MVTSGLSIKTIEDMLNGQIRILFWQYVNTLLSISTTEATSETVYQGRKAKGIIMPYLNSYFNCNNHWKLNDWYKSSISDFLFYCFKQKNRERRKKKNFHILSLNGNRTNLNENVKVITFQKIIQCSSLYPYWCFLFVCLDITQW